ncbi:o-Glycosyl hydrolase family 30 domain-containing protein [Trichoderma breve]|uniref:O-Glycosyl hydrolase family 30 domain-containing protein n=1 Tax=Trichoderma breve TaxID=2034170 RepID=A0A9W9E9A1_9HYPO|nr:o-Glycosyl hydrolase family 30 domain-containing protein [Trichoderma breve]KAJ4862625.1 o-Glycosyl hydrolase family 30 domain-containing protein [Trichoderma breve]
MRSTVIPSLSLVLLFQTAGADTTLSIDPTSNWGTWEGWGVSLAWWAKAFGNRDDLANVFFTRNNQVINGQNLPGLGFNIARYNAGACSTNTYNGSSMVVSSSIKPSRQVDGYWLDWASTDPASSSWNWNVDANQRAMLQKAKANGANIFELFSNSPMWWMCLNHNPSGSGSSDNLQSWNYQNHAVYLANIAQHAQQNWGIQFQSVEAFNEPSSGWGPTGTQEGCHFAVSTMATVIGYLNTELAQRGLSSFVSASDETSYDLAISTWQGLGSSAQNVVKRVNVHGYQGGGGRRDTLYSLVSQAGKRLWNSEYGDADASGKSMYTNLLLDFTWLHPTAWVYWQAIDGSGWGLIVGDNDQLTLSSANPKYFVLAQLTRHIRPGMQILTTPDGNTVAAYDSGSQKLVVVAANWGSAQTITFDLTRAKTAGSNGATVPRWSTQTSGGDQYKSYSDTKINNGKFSVPFSTGQVQTFEISGVVLK